MWKTLYRVMWALARPAALLAAGEGKLARTVRGRRSGARKLAAWANQYRDTARPLIWFHAASVGEGRQGEAVLRRWRAMHPEWQIVFTHASASAERLAASVGADFAGYVPADTTADVRRAVEALKPAGLVFAATDLWPELVRQASRSGARVALVSATLAPTSSRRGGLARRLLAETWATLDRVGAISETDAGALSELGVRRERITVTGDTRHDAAATRAAAVNRSAPELAMLLKPGPLVLVAGSTWPGDERVLLDAVSRLPAGAVQLVIAPHEPSEKHLAGLEEDLRAALPHADVLRLSALSGSAAPRLRVCLVDRVGILADLYAAARIAFVGGGFHGAGLHSVIEPAALGVPVLFGPRHQSSRDATLLLEAGGAKVARDAEHLASMIMTWLDDEASRRRAGDAARAVVDRGIGAADRSVAMLEEMLTKT